MRALCARPREMSSTLPSRRGGSFPVVAADYCYVGETGRDDREGEDPALVIEDQETFAHVAPRKVPEPTTVATVCRGLELLGNRKAILKTDEESRRAPLCSER